MGFIPLASATTHHSPVLNPLSCRTPDSWLSSYVTKLLLPSLHGLLQLLPQPQGWNAPGLSPLASSLVCLGSLSAMTFLSLALSPKLHTYSSKYPTDLSTWISNRHLQGTRPKEDSCSPSPASPSQLMATPSFELPRLKIWKMSLAPLSPPCLIQSVRKQLVALLPETCPESEHFSPSPLLSHSSCPHPSLNFFPCYSLL